jgi:DNA-directed RNA polymerase specialized sigma24 family protein
MLFAEEMNTVAEVSELLFNAKQEAKYSHLLEGFTYAEASEMMYYARNDQ